MQFVFSLFDQSTPALIFPNHLAGWFVMAVALVWGMVRWWEGPSRIRARWWLALALLIAAPLAAGFLGMRLPGDALPVPNTPLDAQPPALMFLAALPWVLAGGLVGPASAALVGLAGGFVLALLETHSPFTPLEISSLALLMGVAMQQDYRTATYRLLRHPLGAMLAVLLAYIPLNIWSTFFFINDSLAVRLDYAFTQIWRVIGARAGEVLIAALVAQALYLALPRVWQRPRVLRPSPSETSIQTRFLLGTLPLVLLLVLTLVVGDWLVAGAAAREMIENRLTSTAEIAAESLPYFTETGQSLILTMASPDLLAVSGAEQSDLLWRRLRSVAFFRQLSVFDAQAQPVNGYPEANAAALRLTEEEQIGLNLALKGVATQVYIADPLPGESSAQVSFLAAIRDENNMAQGVLLGRTDLSSNPFTLPVIQALNGMQAQGGQGLILDEKGFILHSPIAADIRSAYPGALGAESFFRIEPAPKNTRQFVKYMPVQGRPWAVLLTLPTRVAQEMALRIAIPLLGMLLLITAVAFLFLRHNLRGVTSSIQALSQEAAFLSSGQFDHPLAIRGVDEIGRLGTVFEQMRLNLKTRLEELNSLLHVSQGVAANLDINAAVRPILEAALRDGASAARVVLLPEVLLEHDGQSEMAFGIGPASTAYAFLDDQLFFLAQQQDVLTMNNINRARQLQIPPGVPAPGALAAVAVRYESRYFGVLWVAYDSPRAFDDEIRFLSTLAGETALAATSAYQYARAEVGRQRLEAVLASTPEPVLVLDENNRLLLLNPAARQVPGLVLSAEPGCSVQEALGSPDLVEMLAFPPTERMVSREINLANGKIYYASASPVLARERQMGKICILRDITHFKQLEQLKTEFVSTVSHDLRSPLTLMRGYATMLQMVGELNEQQKGYVRKIVTGVENMTRLVTNLLDLGRIETGIGLKIESVSVKDIADEVLNDLQLQAVQKDIRLSLEQDSAGARYVVNVDRALIQQALYNLVENAIKYTPVGGRVKVRMVNRAQSVVVEVQDTGIGIAPLDQPHLFEKFYRSGRREAYQQRGTGLGLAIVKSIAERHGGRAWVDSQLGKGSVFSLEVPCEQT